MEKSTRKPNERINQVQNQSNQLANHFGCYAVFGWLNGEQLGGAFDLLSCHTTMISALQFANTLDGEWVWHIVDLFNIEEILMTNEQVESDDNASCSLH